MGVLELMKKLAKEGDGDEEDEDEEKDEEKADGEKKEEKKDKKDEESTWLKFWKEFNKNPNHPVIVDLLSKVKADKEDKASLDTAQVLFQTALIESGYEIADPSALVNR